jgi:hypothetical protein
VVIDVTAPVVVLDRCSIQSLKQGSGDRVTGLWTAGGL